MPIHIQLFASCNPPHIMLKSLLYYRRGQTAALSPNAIPPRPKLRRDNELNEETIRQLTAIIGTKTISDPISPRTYCRAHEKCERELNGHKLCDFIRAMRSYRTSLEQKARLPHLAAGITAPSF